MILNIAPYPKKLQNLITFAGFREQFYIELRKTTSNNDAYEATEAIHLKYFGRRKYKNWKTFNELRARHARK